MTQAGKPFTLSIKDKQNNVEATAGCSFWKPSSSTNTEGKTAGGDSDSGAPTLKEHTGEYSGDIRSKTTLKRKSVVISDDEYVPTLSSTDDEEYSMTSHEAVSDDLTSKKKKKNTSKIIKKKKKNQSTKVADDGDIAKYNDRMRFLYISKLKSSKRCLTIVINIFVVLIFFSEIFNLLLPCLKFLVN